jgi:hypothetical protein
MNSCLTQLTYHNKPRTAGPAALEVACAEVHRLIGCTSGPWADGWSSSRHAWACSRDVAHHKQNHMSSCRLPLQACRRGERMDWDDESTMNLITNFGQNSSPEDALLNDGYIEQNPLMVRDWPSLGIEYIPETEEWLEQEGLLFEGSESDDDKESDDEDEFVAMGDPDEEAAMQGEDPLNEEGMGGASANEQTENGRRKRGRPRKRPKEALEGHGGDALIQGVDENRDDPPMQGFSLFQ